MSQDPFTTSILGLFVVENILSPTKKKKINYKKWTESINPNVRRVLLYLWKVLVFPSEMATVLKTHIYIN